MYLKKACIFGSVVASIVGWLGAGSSFAAPPDDLREAAKSVEEGVAATGETLTEDAAATGNVEVAAAIGVTTLVATGVMDIVDAFKHPSRVINMENLQQIGI